MQSVKGKKSLFKLVALTTTSILALSACSGDQTSTADNGNSSELAKIEASSLGVSEETAAEMNALYEAAIDAGGKLVLYGTKHENMEDVYDSFEETFPGMTVETHLQTTTDQIAILQAEEASGNYVADLLQNPNGLNYIDLGFTSSYEPPAFSELEGISDEQRSNLHDEEFMYTTPQFTPFGVGYNSNLISGDEVPDNWDEFASPEWEGRLVLHDPTVPGGGQAVMDRLYQAGVVDVETFEGIAKNVSLKGDYAGSVLSLVQGEFPVLLAGAGSDLENNKSEGAPVEFKFMEENNIGLADKWMVLNGSPNPDAGKLFLNFLYTKIGQQGIADAGNLPIREDAESPHGWPSFSEAALADIPTEKELQDGYEESAAVLTNTFRQ